MHRFIFKMEYLIDWVGYPPEEQSWEPHCHLNCAAMLAAYETKLIDQIKNKQANMDGKMEDIREEIISLTDHSQQQTESQQLQQPQQLPQQLPQPEQPQQPHLLQQQEEQDLELQDPAAYEPVELMELEHDQAEQNIDVAQKLPCKECGLLLSNKYSLNRHSANMHNATATKKVKLSKPANQSKLFICNHCAMNFTRLEVLQKHISRKHTNPSDAQFTCTVCGKKLTSPFNLRDHIPICRRRSHSSKSATQTSPNETL